jgi:hypothetical protein
MWQTTKNALRSRTLELFFMADLRENPISLDSPDPWRDDPPRKHTGIRIGALLAVAAAIAFVVWLQIGGSSGTGGASRTSAPKVPASAVPVRVSLQGLTTLGGALTQPIYWAGSKADQQYELTKAADGRVWVRYLPTSAKIGEQSTPYLTIGTYPVPNAFAATLAVAKGGVRIPVGKGAVAFYSPARPTNVYVAYRGSDYQIEVFDPSAKNARGLVASEKIQLIPGSTGASTRASSNGAVALTRLQLVDRAKGAGLPIYWMGAKPGVSYELTQTPAGRSYIRYLPAGVHAGSSTPYLTIGTYPLPNAYPVTKAAAHGAGVVTIKIPGGIAFYKTKSPSNVHVAYPGQDLQIEVYDPSATRAHAVVASGQLAPVH